MKYYTNKARQAGMTLIELTVVLLVLIGLAGLMIPYVSGFVEKTHDATGADSIAALDRTIIRYQGDKMRFPNNVENLVIGVGLDNAVAGSVCPAGTAGDLYCGLMNTNHFAVGALGMASSMSLSMAGITTVLPANADTTDATFAAVQSDAPVTLGMAVPTALVTNAVAILSTGGSPGAAPADAFAVTEDHLASAFGGIATDYDATCYDYVAFGIGENNDMIGSAMHSAPIHFASQGAMGPTAKYNRFIAVFKVDKINATGTANAPGGLAANTTGDCSASVEPAKFIGSGMNMGVNTFIGKSANSKWVYERIAAN